MSSYEDYLRKHGVSLPKQETYDEYLYRNIAKPYVDKVNNLISDLNSIKTPDISKYGDYSSFASSYGQIAFRADKLKNEIKQLKNNGFTEQYSQLSKILEDIKYGADNNRYSVQDAVDFYSSFEDENQYKAWDTDRRLYAEHGDLTAENVDYYIRSMEKRKAKGELNGYEQEFYDWIKQYDLTHGYKDENYVNTRLEQLNRDLQEASKQNGEHYDEYGRKWTMKSADYSEIEGRIGDLTQLRNNLNLDNAYVDKGYSLHKGAVGFDEKAIEYENSVTGEVSKPTSTKDVIKTKNIEDKVVFAYKNKDKYSRRFWKSDLGWLEYTGQNTVEADKIESWYKYSLLEPDEFSTYCYLAQQDKAKGTNSAEKFLSDMEKTLDMRAAEELRKSRKADMNEEGFKGAFSTVLYNTLSVPASVLGGVQALPSAAVSLIKGEDINIYSDSFALSNFASDIRATTSEKIDSPAWNLVYNAVMSTADSILAAYVFRDAAPYVLAASAATSRMKELVSQGASDLEIVVGSLASGAIEVITEKISIDRLFGGDIKPTKFKEWLVQGLIQSGVEGSEEIASEVLNNLSDELIRGQMSDYNQKIRKYQAEGLSKSEATKKASNEILVNIMEAALSGMISGGIGGTVAGGSRMHKLNVVGSNIIKNNNVDSVLEAAEYLGKLDPEIAGQVKALNNFKENATKGKTNAAYNRTLGKVAVTVAENAMDVKQNIVESAVSKELKSRKVGADVVNKVSKIVSKYMAGERLSSSEQGYLKHNNVAATVMQEIKAAQEQIKAEAITPVNAEATASTSSAPQWAIDMVKSLSAVDSAVGVIKYAATGKTEEDEHQAEVNRMIKLLSIASGKTTAEQEAQAGDIPYEQYIKEKAKETAEQKENTAENSGEVEVSASGIYAGMSEEERYEILKDQSVEVVEAKPLELSENDNLEYEDLVKKAKSKIEKPLIEKIKALGFIKKYKSKAIKPDFDFTMKGLRKSLHSQLKYGGDYADLTKIVNNLQELLDKAVLIETHTDKAVGTNRQNPQLKQVYVMVSVFADEKGIIPVQFEVQQMIDEANRLYLAVALTKIETGVTGNTILDKNQASTSLVPISTISLHDLFRNINPQDANFLKYVPDGFLSAEQKQAKNKALEEERLKYGRNKTEVEENFNGFSKVDVSEDDVTYESRLLHTMRGAKVTTEGQAYIKKICQNLGIDVVFENVFTPKGNHADGYIDDNGVIHIDYHCSNPVEFVLKHELTHFGETSSLYKSFCNAVLSSDAFGEWISSKVEDGDTVTLKTALMREQIAELYKRNGVELSPAKQQNEMIANFVGEVLFSSDTNGLERLTTNMTVKEKKSVIDYIKSFIAYIKEKLSKVKGVSSEILSLERKFNELISTADKSKIADEGGIVSYSIKEAERFNPANKTLDEILEEILNNSVSNDGRYLYFGRFASDFVKTMYEKGVLIKELPILMNYRDVYLSMENKENGRYRGENVNYHNLGKDGIKSAIKQIQSPVAVMRSKNPKKLDLVLSFFDYKGRQCLTIVEVNTTVRNMEEFLSAHIVTSVYGKSNIERYIQKAKDEGRMLIDNKKELSQGISPVQYQSNINDNSSTDIIDDNSSSVNSNSMQESSDYLQEDNSENEENTVNGSFSIPTATSEEVDPDTEAREAAQLTDFPDLMAVLTDRRKRGEISEEDYMIEVRDLLDRANEKYGVMEQGELAENKMQLPKRVTEDKSAKTKRWVRTVHESGILPEDMEVELEADILRDAMSYQIIDNATAQRQADAAIKRGTAGSEWDAVVNGTGRIGKREIAIGETLLKLAAERKDSKTVMKLIAEVSEVGTRAGQVVQAMSMLKRMDGIGQLYYVKKTVDKINRDLDKRFGRRLKKGKISEIPQVKINETLAEQLAASKTQEDFDVTYEAMIKEIAEQLPSTFLDKWNAWRYFAMLFNPRTHIRNILGSYGFVPAVRTKDLLASAIERIFLDESKYTKTAIVKKEYREFALKDFAEAENIITGSGKMNPSDEIRDKQAIFDTKWLEKLRKWNFDTLEKEDAIFLKKHYSHALGGFLQARNIDITKQIDSSIMEEARKYAIMEAQKATYRDASAIVNVLQRTAHTKSQVWNSIVEGVLPFKKTPINIVRRGIEYSPIGLIKTLTKGAYDLVNGDITASQFIDGIAGGLTGTGIVILGALLTSLGFINVTGGFGDDEEDDINRLLGRQEYAVEIAGHSYTIDWMAPACIPFFIGVEIQNTLEEKGNANVFQSVKNVTGSALEPIINLSMLSGMQDILSSARYSDGAAVVGSVLWNIALSYGSQALPSLTGAVARTIDGKRRTTYIDKNSWLSDMGQMALNKIESKVPFATMLRSEYVDEFGRTEDSGNVFMRAIQNFLSPGYYSKIEDDPVLEELKALYEQTGESVLPTKPKKYITVNGEKKHLTAEEYEEYSKEVGQERYDYIEELFRSSEGETLSSEEKAKVISDLYSYALAKGKTRYSKYELPDLYEKAYEAEKNGISPVDYYLSKIATNVENADTNGSGTVTKNERLAAIYKMNVSNDIKAALIALYS